MSNNIPQKNIVFNFEHQIKMPYSVIENVSFQNEAQQYINSHTVLNNSFHQFVENDIFIENELYKRSGQSSGPGKDDYQSVRNSENGYKFITIVGGYPEIHQKKDRSTLETLTNLSYENVKYVRKLDMNCILIVCQDKALMFEADFDQVAADECKTLRYNGSNLIVDAVSNDISKVFFGAHIGNTSSIFYTKYVQTDLEQLDSEFVYPDVFKLCDVEGTVSNIEFSDTYKILAVSTNKYIYLIKMEPGLESADNIEKVYFLNESESESVTSLMFNVPTDGLNEDNIITATFNTGDVKIITVGFMPTTYGISTRSFTDVNGSVMINDISYQLTKTGIYSLNNKISGSPSGDIKVYSIYDGILYFYLNSKIYTFNGDEFKSKTVSGISGTVIGIAVVSNAIYIATQKKIYVCPTTGTRFEQVNVLDWDEQSLEHSILGFTARQREDGMVRVYMAVLETNAEHQTELYLTVCQPSNLTLTGSNKITGTVRAVQKNNETSTQFIHEFNNSLYVIENYNGNAVFKRINDSTSIYEDRNTIYGAINLNGFVYLLSETYAIKIDGLNSTGMSTILYSNFRINSRLCSCLSGRDLRSILPVNVDNNNVFILINQSNCFIIEITDYRIRLICQLDGNFGNSKDSHFITENNLVLFNPNTKTLNQYDIKAKISEAIDGRLRNFDESIIDSTDIADSTETDDIHGFKLENIDRIYSACIYEKNDGTNGFMFVNEPTGPDSVYVIRDELYSNGTPINVYQKPYKLNGSDRQFKCHDIVVPPNSTETQEGWVLVVTEDTNGVLKLNALFMNDVVDWYFGNKDRPENGFFDKIYEIAGTFLDNSTTELTLNGFTCGRLSITGNIDNITPIRIYDDEQSTEFKSICIFAVKNSTKLEIYKAEFTIPFDLDDSDKFNYDFNNASIAVDLIKTIDIQTQDFAVVLEQNNINIFKIVDGQLKQIQCEIYNEYACSEIEIPSDIIYGHDISDLTFSDIVAFDNVMVCKVNSNSILTYYQRQYILDEFGTDILDYRIIPIPMSDSIYSTWICNADDARYILVAQDGKRYVKEGNMLANIGQFGTESGIFRMSKNKELAVLTDSGMKYCGNPAVSESFEDIGNATEFNSADDFIFTDYFDGRMSGFVYKNGNWSIIDSFNDQSSVIPNMTAGIDSFTEFNSDSLFTMENGSEILKLKYEESYSCRFAEMAIYDNLLKYQSGYTYDGCIFTANSDSAYIKIRESASKIRLYRYNDASSIVSEIGEFKYVLAPNNVYGSDKYNTLMIVQAGSPFKVGQLLTDGSAQWFSNLSPTTATTVFESMSIHGDHVVLFIKDGITHYRMLELGERLPDNYVFVRTNISEDGDIIYQPVRIKDNKWLVRTNSGLYIYTIEKIGTEFIDFKYSVYDAVNQIDTLSYTTDGYNYKYFASDGNTVIQSEDTLVWTPYLNFRASQNSINDIFYLNEHDNMFVNQNILFYTRYMYDDINNTQRLTEESAYNIYQNMLPDMTDSIANAITEHVDTEHDLNSPMTRLSAYVLPNFKLDRSQIVQLTSNTTEMRISSDYIETIDSSYSADRQFIFASVKNSAIGNSGEDSPWKAISCTYIAKRWASGLVDMYIYLPTTYTYYIPHIPYAGLCRSNGDETPSEQVKVNGRMLNATISDNETSVRIEFLSAIQYIDALMLNTIKPNSLPLRIFKAGHDYESEENYASELYHSFVEPSTACPFNPITTPLERYQFDYRCFGSDAQAIHLQFFDSQRNYEKEYKIVVYHGNGGMAQNDRTTDIIYQYVLKGNNPKQLFTADYFWNDRGGIFVGWTRALNGNIGSQLYLSNTISYDDISGDELHLYAVWNYYQFSDDDTSITINTTAGEKYTIAEITVDPDHTFNNGNTALGRHVIIDFDS